MYRILPVDIFQLHYSLYAIVAREKWSPVLVISV